MHAGERSHADLEPRRPGQTSRSHSQGRRIRPTGALPGNPGRASRTKRFGFSPGRESAASISAKSRLREALATLPSLTGYASELPGTLATARCLRLAEQSRPAKQGLEESDLIPGRAS